VHKAFAAGSMPPAPGGDWISYGPSITPAESGIQPDYTFIALQTRLKS